MEYSKEEKNIIDKAFPKIYELFRRGGFPDQSVKERHLQKLYDFEVLSDNKIRFKLDRHPHAFGFSSLGTPSSAYHTITYLYELDTEKNTIIKIYSEAGELLIKYEWLADEELLDLFNYDFDEPEYIMEWEEDLQKIDSEEKAKQYAITKFVETYEQDTYWFIKYDSKDLPEDFKSRLLEELKKLFIPKLVEIWEKNNTGDEN